MEVVVEAIRGQKKLKMTFGSDISRLLDYN